ncbi:hypothetical protein [Curtobacterium sp. MCLR17_054]|uniref:hypothetical protein n=1 Tax=Curtobacterium sp. MCLR17_054 TaxID=2175632 RepID=UPI0011B3AFAE|nr:hypothetical protein [Curtobacterium sp. MCLR17_054]WIE70268.1 hypothetical protein DEJ08_018685 [Curtobacterium sp. MCLR17_054]
MNVSIGRFAADRTREDLAAGRTSPDQVTAAAAARAAALDDAMHNLTVKAASPTTSLQIAAEAYGEWQHTSPAIAERAVNLFAAVHEEDGVAPTATLQQIAAAVDTERFHDRTVRGVEFGLRSSAATQDDLASGVIETADLDGYADGVRDHVNDAIDRLEHDPGSAASAVELAANAYAEFGSATNAEALYAAAHETAGTAPTAPLDDVLTGVIDRWSSADEAAAAEHRQLGSEQAAAAADVDSPRTSTGELISLEVDQHVEQMTQTWVELANEPGREVEAHSAYATLVTEVDNLKLDGTYLDPRTATGDRADELPTPVPEEVVEHLGDLNTQLQLLEDQVIIYSGNAGPDWFDGAEPTPADPARVADAHAQADSVRAELHQQLEEHGLAGTQWDPRHPYADPALTSTGDPGSLEGDQHVSAPHAPNEPHAASSTADSAAPTVEQKRVSSYPMDVASSLRHAATAHADPAAPSTGPSRPTSSTQRGGGIER